MHNGRRRLPGTKSTGPRTSEGLERCRVANWKHGRSSAEALAERRRVRDLLDQSAQVIRAVRTGGGLKGLAERLFAGMMQGTPRV